MYNESMNRERIYAYIGVTIIAAAVTGCGLLLYHATRTPDAVPKPAVVLPVCEDAKGYVDLQSALLHNCMDKLQLFDDVLDRAIVVQDATPESCAKFYQKGKRH